MFGHDPLRQAAQITSAILDFCTLLKLFSVDLVQKGRSRLSRNLWVPRCQKCGSIFGAQESGRPEPLLHSPISGTPNRLSMVQHTNANKPQPQSPPNSKFKAKNAKAYVSKPRPLTPSSFLKAALVKHMFPCLKAWLHVLALRIRLRASGGQGLAQ